jgi:hypothetical protein
VYYYLYVSEGSYNEYFKLRFGSIVPLDHCQATPCGNSSMIDVLFVIVL